MSLSSHEHTAGGVRFDTVVSGGTVVDPERGVAQAADVGVRAGRIAAVAERIPADAAARVVHADGGLVVPGLIDLHAHVFAGRTGLGVDADRVGVDAAVTTVIDAGSTGARDFDVFRAEVVDRAHTRVLSFLNIAEPGLVDGTRELALLDDVGGTATRELLEREAHGRIRGIKLRMSSSVVGDNGMRPLEIARGVADEYRLPIMVHVGNEPPAYADVLDMLREGDVVTHAFHGKAGGLFGGGRSVSAAALRARDRGVLFDVGHGSASLSFTTLERAIEHGFPPDVVSTDVHAGNIDGPVYGLAETMSKLLAVGLSIVDVVRCASTVPAGVIGESGSRGTLSVGAVADLSVLSTQEGVHELVDADGDIRSAQRSVRGVMAIRDGVPSRGEAARR